MYLAGSATTNAILQRAGPFYKSVGMLKNIVTFHELANQVTGKLQNGCCRLFGLLF
jgi:hypothetical protein